MKRSAWLFMFFSLSVYAVGCGGGDEGGDSTDGTDNSSADASAGDSPVKVQGGDPFDPSALTDNATTTDSSTDVATKGDVTPTTDPSAGDGASKPFVAPPIDIDIPDPTFKIDDPFAIPDAPIKKDGGAAKDS